MRYDEKEEIEATGEWLMRINKAGFSEELVYFPSRLAELGVAPRDVVDRQEWLRDHYHGIVEPEEVEESVSTDPIQDHDNLGPWEWADGVDVIISSSMKLFEPDPEIPQFNELAGMARNRTRGRRARLSSRRKLMDKTVR